MLYYRMNIAILGDGYIGQAFNALGTVIPYEKLDHAALGYNKYKQLREYDVVINTVEMTDMTDFHKLWKTNVQLVRDLSAYCSHFNKKFVQISTADLYGNYMKWKEDIETSYKLDVGTDYRFTKLAAEKFCHPTDLIIRIRNAFDGRVDYDNAIIKGYMADKMFLFANSWSYLPDVVKAITTLINKQCSGIYNVVGEENMSLFYVLKSVLEVPIFKQIDEVKDINPYFATEVDRHVIHNDVNAGKIVEVCKPMPLEAAFIVSWVTLAEHFVTYFDKTKLLNNETEVVA